MPPAGGADERFLGALRTGAMFWTWPFGEMVVQADQLVVGLSLLPFRLRHVVDRSELRQVELTSSRGVGAGGRFTTTSPGRPGDWVLFAVNRERLIRTLEANGWAVSPASPKERWW